MSFHRVLFVVLTLALVGCTSAQSVVETPGVPFSQTILDALEPGQQVIITRTDKSRIAGNVVSFDNQAVVLRHGQDSITVPVNDIAALMVREHSRAKTAAVSGSVTIGVLMVLVVSSFLSIFDFE